MEKEFKILGRSIIISTFIATLMICFTILANSYIHRNKVYLDGRKIVDPVFHKYYVPENGDEY